MASHCADWHVDACEKGNGCVGVLWWRKGLWACWACRSTLQLSATCTTVVSLEVFVHLSIFHAKDSLGHNFCMYPGTKRGIEGKSDFGSQRMVNTRRVLEGQHGHMNKAWRESPRQLLITQRGFQRHFAFWIFEVKGIKAYRKSFPIFNDVHVSLPNKCIVPRILLHRESTTPIASDELSQAVHPTRLKK